MPPMVEQRSRETRARAELALVRLLHALGDEDVFLVVLGGRVPDLLASDEALVPDRRRVSQAGFDGDSETRDPPWKKGTPKPCHDRRSTPMSCWTAERRWSSTQAARSPRSPATWASTTRRCASGCERQKPTLASARTC